MAESHLFEDIYIIYTLHLISLTRSKAHLSDTLNGESLVMREIRSQFAQAYAGIAEVHMHALQRSCDGADRARLSSTREYVKIPSDLYLLGARNTQECT